MLCGQRLENVRMGECVLTRPAIAITVPDEGGRRLAKVLMGERVLAQPAITITIPDDAQAAVRESARGCSCPIGHHDGDPR